MWLKNKNPEQSPLNKTLHKYFFIVPVLTVYYVRSFCPALVLCMFVLNKLTHLRLQINHLTIDHRFNSREILLMVFLNEDKPSSRQY